MASSSSSSSKLEERAERGKTNKDDEVLLVAQEDKISELPDAILCHILSFFTTRDAVRTSILSRRWRYLWTSVPCIDLSISEWSLSTKRKFCFPDVVDRVLHLNELHCLRKFSLSWRQTYDSSRVNEWISKAIMRRGIEDIHLYSPQSFELPPSIFTRKKLKKLNLIVGVTFLLNMTVSVCLPSIKSIHLHGVRFCNDDFLKNLLEGCPVLEELDIFYNSMSYFDDHIRTFFVKSSSLKRLSLWLTPIITSQSIQLGIVVEAPNLERLIIKGVATENIVVNHDLCFLVHVSLGLHSKISESVEDNAYGNIRLFELLGKMSNTKSMSLCRRCKEFLGEARRANLPTFHNLVDLMVEDHNASSWLVLPYLLECSPNLINFYYKSFSDCKLQFRKPKCLMLYLEKIILKTAPFQEFSNDEMRIVRYFLKNAPVLKEITILSISGKEDSKMLKRLSRLQSRRSTACRITAYFGTTSTTFNVQLKKYNNCLREKRKVR